MIIRQNQQLFLQGEKGRIPLKDDDEITLKIAMLYQGECEGKGRAKTAQEFGYSRQRYYQILQLFIEKGAEGLKKQRTGPKSDYVRTDEIVRQIIRYRYLDPKISAEVIAQRLRQAGHPISLRSVERVITEYGLQKKTPSPAAAEGGKEDRNTP